MSGNDVNQRVMREVLIHLDDMGRVILSSTTQFFDPCMTAEKVYTIPGHIRVLGYFLGAFMLAVGYLLRGWVDHAD